MAEGRAHRFTVFVEGLDALKQYDELPAKVLKAASRAINATATYTRTMSAQEIARQVAFPASYLNPADGRLVVATYAQPDSLTAAIVARKRPTSLARFMVSGNVPGTKQQGATVAVKPGLAKFLPTAFVLRLRGSGGDDLNAGANVGLAVRTKDGQPPPTAYKPTKLGNNLWLLYGPSVDQVFQSVRYDVKDRAEAYLNNEFRRLMELNDA